MIQAWNLLFDAIYKGYGLIKHFADPYGNLPLSNVIQCYRNYKLQNIEALSLTGRNVRQCVNVSIWDLQTAFKRHSWRRLKQHMTHEIMHCRRKYNNEKEYMDCYADKVS